MIANYTCKICLNPGSVEYEPLPDLEKDAFNVEAWTKILCHDRCAKYAENKLKVERAVSHVCFILSSIDTEIANRKDAGIPDEDIDPLKHGRAEAVEKYRKHLIRALKTYITIVARPFHRERIDEHDAYLELIEHPKYPLKTMRQLFKAVVGIEHAEEWWRIYAGKKKADDKARLSIPVPDKRDVQQTTKPEIWETRQTA